LATDPDKFIDHLVADLKPTPPLRSPGFRTVISFSFLAVVTAMTILWVQEYRPGFWMQLSEHWRFKAEIVSGIVLTLSTFYIVFASSIPGEKINYGAKLTCLVSFIVFAGSLGIGFGMASPESSALGSRPFCELEVLIYGGLSMGGLFYLIRNGIIVSYSSKNVLLGFSAGLISALIMQLACMYDPLHGLLFHFIPALLLGALGWLLSDRIKSYRDRKTNVRTI
jgi:hypothetical protein